MAQHDILVQSLKKLAEDAEGENGGWKIKLINLHDVNLILTLNLKTQILILTFGPTSKNNK